MQEGFLGRAPLWWGAGARAGANLRVSEVFPHTPYIKNPSQASLPKEPCDLKPRIL